jgi:malate/lactate dehydrogenase
MREVAIIGAGDLGGATMHELARRNAARSVTLIDEQQGAAVGKALDMAQAAPVEGFATELSGSSDVSSASGADVVVIADRFGAGEWQGEEALALLKRVGQMAPRALVVCAGATSVTLIDRGVRELKVPRVRLLGSAPEALASGVRALVALAIDGTARDVALTVLALPPARTVIPWSDATVAGFALTRCLTEPARRQIEARVASLWPPGPLALAAAATAVVAAIDGRSRRIVSCFVAPDPSVSERERHPSAASALAAPARAAAMPVRLGPSGVVETVLPGLSVAERVAWENAVSL